MVEGTTLDVKRFLSSMTLTSVEDEAPATDDAFPHEQSREDRFLAGLGALVHNVAPANGRLPKGAIQELILEIDSRVQATLDLVLHHPSFQAVESAWRGLEDLIKHTNFHANITLDIMDASKEELAEDFETHSVDVTESAVFGKIYREEYDQFGGKPYGAVVGLYSFSSTPQDLFFIRQMGKVCALSHSPFLTSASPRFFGCETAEQLSAITDLEGLLKQPRYGAWQTLRDAPEAAYVALTLPRYLLRRPWDPETNPSEEVVYSENASKGPEGQYLWGNPAILMARNLVRSFELSGWCQHIRGPKAGGLLPDLVGHELLVRGESELKAPVELSIPDTRELEFANQGFIPVIYRTGTTEACIFSCQSIKAPKRFKDPKDTENAQLVTNLSYTLSISRIAHYLKCMMRDVIGTTADANSVQSKIQDWLEEYVTTVINPDDLTLSFYPFKAAKVEVTPSEGVIGHYRCTVAVLPHIQFEGIDVELRLESRLG
jgi:type VI secretion system protein ImpC